MPRPKFPRSRSLTISRDLAAGSTAYPRPRRVYPATEFDLSANRSWTVSRPFAPPLSTLHRRVYLNGGGSLADRSSPPRASIFTLCLRQLLHAPGPPAFVSPSRLSLQARGGSAQPVRYLPSIWSVGLCRSSSRAKGAPSVPEALSYPADPCFLPFQPSLSPAPSFPSTRRQRLELCGPGALRAAFGSPLGLLSLWAAASPYRPPPCLPKSRSLPALPLRPAIPAAAAPSRPAPAPPAATGRSRLQPRRRRLPFRVLYPYSQAGTAFCPNPGPEFRPAGKAPAHGDRLARRLDAAGPFKYSPHAYAAALCAGGVPWRTALDALPFPDERQIARPFRPQACEKHTADGRSCWTPKLAEAGEKEAAGVRVWAGKTDRKACRG